MTEHATGTREEWLAARLELLEAEKELTRRSDELARQRRCSPGFGSTRNTASTLTKAESDTGGPVQRALAALDLPLHVGSRYRRVARVAPRLPTATTASSSTSRTTT